MPQINDIEKMYNSLLVSLRVNSPVLSGNMSNSIQTQQANPNEFVIVIDAPFYDINKWKQSGAVIHTGKSYGGKNAYAESVNRSGAFGRNNKSQNWVNRVCVEVANTIAAEIGAEVINELEI